MPESLPTAESITELPSEGAAATREAAAELAKEADREASLAPGVGAVATSFGA